MVAPDSFLVQNLTQYRLDVLIPVPLSGGCVIEIIFPPEIVLDTQLSLVTSFGLPNA